MRRGIRSQDWMTETFDALYLLLSASEARLPVFTTRAGLPAVLAPSNALLHAVTFLDATSTWPNRSRINETMVSDQNKAYLLPSQRILSRL